MQSLRNDHHPAMRGLTALLDGVCDDRDGRCRPPSRAADALLSSGVVVEVGFHFRERVVARRLQLIPTTWPTSISPTCPPGSPDGCCNWRSGLVDARAKQCS